MQDVTAKVLQSSDTAYMMGPASARRFSPGMSTALPVVPQPGEPTHGQPDFHRPEACMGCGRCCRYARGRVRWLRRL